MTAASGAGGSHPVHVGLSYSCRFPSATYPVTAIVSATFPASAASGTPIQPAGLEVMITLPKQAVAYLRGLGAATVSATGELAVTATSHGTPAEAAWQLRTSTAVAVPASGSLTLDSTGAAPPAAASAPGIVRFVADGLTMLLTPQSASGATTNPANVSASCQLAAGTPSRLASVSVTSASPSASASASPSVHHKATSPKKKNPKLKIPKGCGHIKVHGFGQAVCGYIVGYSDVKKLYGAAALGPVLVNIDFAYRHVIHHNHLIAYTTGRIYNEADHGEPVFPPVRSTFLGFGFVPVTATLTLREVGTINIVSNSITNKPPYRLSLTAKSKVAISVSDVTVNGVPLQVGSGCRTAHPAELTLHAHGANTFPPRGYTIPTGGPLTGTLTIPKFVHCGVTQNLDPLLTGSISGPGNFAKMIQGELCGPADPAGWTCPPPIPKRRR
jgi:hypothetical protein